MPSSSSDVMRPTDYRGERLRDLLGANGSLKCTILFGSSGNLLSCHRSRSETGVHQSPRVPSDVSVVSASHRARALTHVASGDHSHDHTVTR